MFTVYWYKLDCKTETKLHVTRKIILKKTSAGKLPDNADYPLALSNKWQQRMKKKNKGKNLYP